MTGPVDRHDFWRRTLPVWDVAFYALVAVAGVSALLLREDRAQVLGVAVAVLLALAYTLVGRRAALTGSGRLADTYLVVLVALVSTAAAVGDHGFVLLFVAYSQIWFFCRTRRAGLVWCVLLTAAVTTLVATVRLDGDPAAVADVAGSMGVSLVFSVLMGLWITGTAERGEERAELVEQLEAAQEALAVEHHAAGVLAERARVAQEIHDTLAQGFTSVVMLAQATRAELDQGRHDQVQARLVQVEDVARENLREARALVAAFGPPGLEGASLGQALERLARRFEAETGLVVTVEGARTAPLASETEVVLLRAAQEALANVRRHAGAGAVRVRLDVVDGTATLDVADDGRGLPDDVVEGVGLRGMRDRASARGGTLSVGPVPAGGTSVRVALPVPAAAQEVP